MTSQKKLAECYQPLFNLLHQEHNLILTIAELDEIIAASEKVEENIDELFTGRCDVDGCEQVPSGGGSCWPDTGYWRVCPQHSKTYRNGHPQPKMKKDSVKREASRMPDGCLPAEW